MRYTSTPALSSDVEFVKENGEYILKSTTDNGSYCANDYHITIYADKDYCVRKSYEFVLSVSLDPSLSYISIDNDGESTYYLMPYCEFNENALCKDNFNETYTISEDKTEENTISFNQSVINGIYFNTD